MKLLTRDFKIYKWSVSFSAIIWFLLAFIGVALKIKLGHDKIGNYLIFDNAFWNTIHQVNLYFVDPAKGLGSYLYGPLFSIIMAPFALFSINAGAFLWGLFNAAFLFYAIRQLPVSYRNQNLILLASSVEMMTSVQNMQINCLIAAWILLACIHAHKNKVVRSTLFTALGFMVKIYGIVGLTFFFFTRQKIKFTLSFIGWLLLLFCLPMLLSSPSFIVQSYHEWFSTLMQKNDTNLTSDMQNISVMGMLKHVTTSPLLNVMILIPAAILYGIPLLRTKQYNQPVFQFSYLAFALIGVVIFSSSAESPTYIIAFTGVALWYVLQDTYKKYPFLLLITTFLLTSLSSTDLFPSYLKTEWVRPYALKALPCFLVWQVLAVQLVCKDFTGTTLCTDSAKESILED